MRIEQGHRWWARPPAAAPALLLLAVACTAAGSSGGTHARDVRVAPTPTTSPTESTSPAPRHGWVVSLGDSYISGEGARWGANTNGPARQVDALGPAAYFDKGGQESQPGCHRASSTIVSLGLPAVRGKNFACSGARSRSDGSQLRFKPGLDFARAPAGAGVGQARALQLFASRHRVLAVVVSIGGNDFGFGELAARCVSGFLSSPPGAERLCSTDPAVTSRVDRTAQRRVQAAVTAALNRVTAAMSRAGYAAADYRRVLLTYPSPIPPGDALRFSVAERDVRGGCPLFAADATWADTVALARINDTVVSAASASRQGFSVLDLASAFDGHRLCERGTAPLSDTELRRWDGPAAADRVEWVNRVYYTIAPHQLQESLHPGYWGTAAERQCLRLWLARPVETSYACTGAGPGLVNGDPRMTLRRSR